ncbi:C4-type zinc finger protein, DksA/TraR family [Vibrio chagasii]|nr:C4-type zinc finger protein, DksA/TraR family [Vibrio chagasii]
MNLDAARLVLNSLNKTLTVRREETLKSIKDLPNVAVGTSDSGDQSQHLELQQLLNAELSHTEQRIKSVAFALKQMDDDMYGFCESCGVDIEEERMKKTPESVYCVECLNQIEHKGKGFRHREAA